MKFKKINETLLKEKVLTEDEFDMYDENPDDVADELIQNQKQQKEIQKQKELQDKENAEQAERQTFRDRDFSQEYSKAKTDVEKDKILEDFLAEFSKYNDINISSFKQALKEHLSMLGAKGLRQTENPYLIFIVKLSKINKSIITSITDNGYRNLIRLVSDSILNQNMLINVSASSILAVKDLYSKTYDEMKYYCQCYYYLSNTQNAKTINERLVNMYQDENSVKEFSRIIGDSANFINYDQNGEATLTNLNNENFWKFMLFVNGSNLTSNLVDAKFRDARKIQDALSYLDTFVDDKSIEDKDDIKDAEPSEQSVDIFNKSRLDKIDKETAIGIVNQLIKKYNIKI